MLLWVSNIFALVTNACAEWSATLFLKTGVLPIYWYMLGIALTVRFLIVPLVGSKISGGGSSDKAKKSGNKDGGK